MPGTPMAKSHSLSSVNCFTCFGFINCSASPFSSSGLRAAYSSGVRSPFRRIVGGRPTLRCRSDPPICVICWSTALKSNGGPAASSDTAVAAGGAAGFWPGRGGGPMGGFGGLAIGINPEKRLPVFHRLRVLSESLADYTGVFRLDLVHDLHRFDDAKRLSLRDAIAHGNVGLGAGLRRAVERAHHRRFYFEQ